MPVEADGRLRYRIKSDKIERVVNGTLAVAPQFQRHVCRSLWLAQSMLMQSSRTSPFRCPCLCSKKFRSWPEVQRLVRWLRGEHAVWSR